MYLFHYSHGYYIKLEYNIIDLYQRNLKVCVLKVCVSSSFYFSDGFSQCFYIILKKNNPKNPRAALHMYNCTCLFDYTLYIVFSSESSVIFYFVVVVVVVVVHIRGRRIHEYFRVRLKSHANRYEFLRIRTSNHKPNYM